MNNNKFTKKSIGDLLEEKRTYIKDSLEEFWWNNGEIIKIFLAVVAFFIFFGVAIYIVMYINTLIQCNSLLNFGYETKMNFWTSTCFIYHEEFGWLPSEAYFNFLNINTK